MTGFGTAASQNDQLNIAVELRTVNNRYFKITTKCPESYSTFESRIEKIVRGTISRGTVTVTVRASQIGVDGQYILDRKVLESYWSQLNELADDLELAAPNDPTHLLALPGVVCEDVVERMDRETDWPVVSDALTEALGNLQKFRVKEGCSIREDLQANCKLVVQQIDEVSKLAPKVVVEYRQRLLERVRELLQESEASIDPDNLIREVSIFADKCDINEEITRLRCHLDQFETFLSEETSMGRKLEFLSQEMFREVNTIGSKANNVSIAHCVVEMKAAVERIRENLQNVE